MEPPEQTGFVEMPHEVFGGTADKDVPVAVLSSNAQRLLMNVFQQFRGNNNGCLSASPKAMSPYRWKSRGALTDATVSLVAHGFLQQTRKGGKGRISLYAVTWLGIDEGEHDAEPNEEPSRLWLPENRHLRDETFVRRWETRRNGHRKTD